MGVRRKRRRDLAGAVQNLVNSSSRLSYLPRMYPTANLKPDRDSLKPIPRDSMGFAEGFYFGIYNGVMPKPQLADGTVPLVLDPEHQGSRIVITSRLASLDAPLFKPIWDLMLQRRQNFGSFHWSASWPDGNSRLSVYYNMHRRKEADINLHWMRGQSEEWSINEFADRMGLNELEMESPGKEEKVTGPGMTSSNVRTYLNAPTEGMLERIDQFFRSLPEPWICCPEIEVVFNASTGGLDPVKSQYNRLYPQLNEIGSCWNSTIRAFYEDGFDPFVDPIDIPKKVGEVRFPVISSGLDPFSGPSLQVDIVYRQKSSFLEFITRKKNAASLRKQAKAAGIELELCDQKDRF